MPLSLPASPRHASSVCILEPTLSPYLILKGIQVITQALFTNKKLGAKGGMISFSQAMRDLENMTRQFYGDGMDIHLFTTMFDLYALPDDFPGYDRSLQFKDYDQVTSLEQELGKFVNKQNFILYIQLHEFEALVLCNIPELVRMYLASCPSTNNVRPIFQNGCMP